MKTQMPAKKIASKALQKPQIFKRNSFEQNLAELKGAKLESDQKNAFHTSKFSLSNLSLNPSSFIKTTGGVPMPEAVQQKMEATYNTDFSDVRIHEGQEAELIGAIAYTNNSQIYFAPGQYNPLDTEGQKVLGHELAHVMQQRAGRVTLPSASEIVVNDPVLESEADNMSIKAARGEDVQLSGMRNQYTRSNIGKAQSGLAVQCLRKRKNDRKQLLFRDELNDFSEPLSRPGKNKRKQLLVEDALDDFSEYQDSFLDDEDVFYQDEIPSPPPISRVNPVPAVSSGQLTTAKTGLKPLAPTLPPISGVNPVPAVSSGQLDTARRRLKHLAVAPVPPVAAPVPPVAAPVPPVAAPVPPIIQAKQTMLANINNLQPERRGRDIRTRQTRYEARYNSGFWVQYKWGDPNYELHVHYVYTKTGGHKINKNDVKVAGSHMRGGAVELDLQEVNQILNRIRL